MNVLKMLSVCNEVHVRRMINPPGVEVEMIKDGLVHKEFISQTELDYARETESRATIFMEHFQRQYEIQRCGRIG